MTEYISNRQYVSPESAFKQLEGKFTQAEREGRLDGVDSDTPIINGRCQAYRIGDYKNMFEVTRSVRDLGVYEVAMIDSQLDMMRFNFGVRRVDDRYEYIFEDSDTRPETLEAIAGSVIRYIDELSRDVNARKA